MRRADLPALPIFAAVAARRSFRGAARDLGRSVSAVSHAINGLEDHLGVRLLARTTRSVAPTEAGQRLLDGLEPALAAITEAVEAAAASQQQLCGTLCLSVPRAAAEMVLIPLVTAFTRAHPGVTIEIRVQNGLSDIVAEGFDAGIPFAESLEQDMIAVPLGPPQRGAIVAAPAYLAQHAPPATPQDLQAHTCIRRRFAGGALYQWELNATEPPARCRSPAISSSTMTGSSPRRRGVGPGSPNCSRRKLRRISHPAGWSGSWRIGARAFPASSSTIPAAG